MACVLGQILSGFCGDSSDDSSLVSSCGAGTQLDSVDLNPFSKNATPSNPFLQPPLLLYDDPRYVWKTVCSDMAREDSQLLMEDMKVFIIVKSHWSHAPYALD
ncbi:hypothetical protein GQ600_4777 [Phytophthora cactorum]|nr:hypothetical protein GQ600_4777 [Phytophthora cactorum]